MPERDGRIPPWRFHKAPRIGVQGGQVHRRLREEIRMRRFTTLLVTAGVAIGSAGMTGCGEDDVEDAARDAGNTAEDAFEQGKDEAGEVGKDVERELEE